MMIPSCKIPAKRLPSNSTVGKDPDIPCNKNWLLVCPTPHSPGNPCRSWEGQLCEGVLLGGMVPWRQLLAEVRESLLCGASPRLSFLPAY